MSTTQHGSYLTQITRLGMMNSYLVREDDGLTLIDSGMPGSAPAILKAAAALGAPIVRIVLTHAHVDHVGSLDALVAALPTASVAIGSREARFLAGDMSLDPNEAQAPLKGGFPTIATRPSRLLNDGDKIGSLRAVFAPGHTPGHMAFFDERDGSLIVGDAFQTLGGLAVSGVLRLLFPLPALATWHGQTALASARRLRALNPTRLAVGHGATLEQPGTKLGAAIDVAERKFGGVARNGA